MKWLERLWKKQQERWDKRPDWFLYLDGVAFLLLLLACLFAYAKFQGGTVSWFLFYAMLPFLGYGLLLALYPLEDFVIERKVVSGEVQVGSRLEVELHLQRRIGFPLFYLSVEDVLPEGWRDVRGQSVGKLVVVPLFRKRLCLRYFVENLPRGEFQLKRVNVQVRDVLGLVRFRKCFWLQDTILVFPQVGKVDLPALLADYDSGNVKATANLHRDSGLISGVRAYVPGDRMAKIDWKSTAKRADLMTKDFEDKRSQQLLLLLDTNAETEVFEQMVRLCASYLCAALENAVEVGLYIQQEHPIFCSQSSGKMQRKKCLLELTRVEANASAMVTLNSLEQFSSLQNADLIYLTSRLTAERLSCFLQLGNRQMGRRLLVFRESFEDEKAEVNQWVEQEAQRHGVSVIYY